MWVLLMAFARGNNFSITWYPPIINPIQSYQSNPINGYDYLSEMIFCSKSYIYNKLKKLLNFKASSPAALGAQTCTLWDGNGLALDRDLPPPIRSGFDNMLARFQVGYGFPDFYLSWARDRFLFWLCPNYTICLQFIYFTVRSCTWNFVSTCGRRKRHSSTGCCVGKNHKSR